MHKPIVLGCLIAVGASGPALAAGEISYSFVEAGYLSNEIEDADLDGSGAAVNASIGFGEHMFAFANVMRSAYRHSPVTSRAYSLGIGHAMPLSTSMDLVAGLSYERVLLDAHTQPGTFDVASERGVAAQVGVRGRAAESVEFTGNLKYTHLSAHLHDFTFMAGGRYYFTPTLAAGADVSKNDDGLAWVVGLRYDFGGR